MPIQSEQGLFQVLEQELRKDKGPKKPPEYDMSKAVAYDAVLEGSLNKPTIEVSPDGCVVTLTTQYATITIAARDVE